jgi:hypothetical protein
MQVVFFAAFELLGWALGERFSLSNPRTPLWARIAGAFLLVVAAFIGAALVTGLAVVAWGFVQVLAGRS